LLKLDPEFVIENEMMTLGLYSNTYTITKSMVERAITKKRGNLKVTIVRPTIIMSSYEEPVQGWTDTLAAGDELV
jgi:fatty acyl-CoA reductase